MSTIDWTSYTHLCNRMWAERDAWYGTTDTAELAAVIGQRCPDVVDGEQGLTALLAMLSVDNPTDEVVRLVRFAALSRPAADYGMGDDYTGYFLNTDPAGRLMYSAHQFAAPDQWILISGPDDQATAEPTYSEEMNLFYDAENWYLPDRRTVVTQDPGSPEWFRDAGETSTTTANCTNPTARRPYRSPSRGRPRRAPRPRRTWAPSSPLPWTRRCAWCRAPTNCRRTRSRPWWPACSTTSDRDRRTKDPLVTSSERTPGTLEQLSATLRGLIVEKGGETVGDLVATVDTDVLLAPDSPVIEVITTTTTDTTAPPPPLDGPSPPTGGVTTGNRYRSITAVRHSEAGVPIVWSAQDSQNGNALGYAASAKFRPGQSAPWSAEQPPTGLRYLGISHVERPGFDWGVGGFRWWQAVDATSDGDSPAAYVRTTDDTEPGQDAGWIGPGEFDEQMTALEENRARLRDNLAVVDGRIAKALHDARDTAIATMERNHAYPKHGDDRWYLPPREAVRNWLRREISERFTQ